MDFDEPCSKCPEKYDVEHMALEHGWLDKVLKDTEMIDRKRSEIAQDRTSNSSGYFTKNNTAKIRLNTELKWTLVAAFNQSRKGRINDAKTLVN